MKRAARLVLFAVLVGVTACGELGGGTGQISKRIGEITSDPAAKIVDLPKLTTFGWDRFYFFKPGTSRQEICRFIGADRNTCGRVIRYESVPSDHMALLFGLNGNLTHTELHALANGQFDLPQDEAGFPKERSVFRIHRTSAGTSQDAVLLEPL
jgi:hypothetical protein